MKINSGLPEKAAKNIVHALSITLGDIHQLYIKTLGFHWNVEGPRFGPLHALFEEQYTLLAEHLDTVAERIRKLGEKAPGSVKQLSSLTRLKDSPDTQDEEKMLHTLAEDYEFLLPKLREEIASAEDQGDPGTADMLIAILRSFEKQAWMLRSHLEGK